MDDINTEQYMKSIQWSAEAQWKTCLTRKRPKRVEIWTSNKGDNSYVTLADWRRGYNLKARVL